MWHNAKYFSSTFFLEFHSMIAVDNNAQVISNFNVFPNPSNGIINFEYTLQEEEHGEIQIFDIAGRLIQHYQLNNTESKFTINNLDLNAGTYMYKYSINGQIVNTEKLIIIK